MADKGWIKLNRQITEHWIWENHEFAFAWIDLLLSVNHENNKIYVDGELVTIRRGQILTSIYKLSQRWHWSRNKTYKFILALEKDGMLKRSSTTHYTMLTVVNYGKYQDRQSTVGDTKGTTADTTKGLQVEHKQEYIKNDKECKEEPAALPSEDDLAGEVDEDDDGPWYTGEELLEMSRKGLI